MRQAWRDALQRRSTNKASKRTRSPSPTRKLLWNYNRVQDDLPCWVWGPSGNIVLHADAARIRRARPSTADPVITLAFQGRGQKLVALRFIDGLQKQLATEAGEASSPNDLRDWLPRVFSELSSSYAVVETITSGDRGPVSTYEHMFRHQAQAAVAPYQIRRPSR